MAITSNSYTGNGSTTLYSFTFPYLDESHVKVTLAGALTTAYTFANATTIQFNTAPGAGVAIRIYRETNNDQTEATFFAGSSIKAQDLNNNFTQTLYTVQEVVDRYLSKVGDTMQGILNMGGFKITNLGAPTLGTDATTKSYVDGYINTTYLGPSATDPTTRPGGSPLQVGDQYFNTNQNILKAWTGTVWVISAAAGSIVRWRKTASAGNTTLSGVDDLGITLSYVVGNEQVFLNGALQTRGVDYTAATGTSITFTPALLAGDVVELHAVQGYVSATVPDGSVGETKLANGAVTSAKIADGTIVDADVNALAGIGASKLAFTQSGAGATARTVDSKLKDVVSVKDFGAVGDGVTNDTAAIQAALNSGAPCILIPPGTYRITGVTVPATVLEIRGLGKPTINVVAASNAVGFTIVQYYVRIHNLIIKSTGTNVDGLSTKGIVFGSDTTAAGYCWAESLELWNFSGRGIQVKRSIYMGLADINCRSCYYGISIETATSVVTTTTSIDRCYISGSVRGINLNSCVVGTIKDAIFEYSGDGTTTDGALHIVGGRNIAVINSYFEANGRNRVISGGSATFINVELGTATSADVINQSALGASDRGYTTIRNNGVTTRKNTIETAGDKWSVTLSDGTTNVLNCFDSGRFIVGTDTDSGFHEVRRSGISETTPILGFSTSGSNYPVAIYGVTGAGANGAAAAILVGKGSATNRSINAGGTVNANGADYAEYMRKAGNFIIAKGEICGITADGLLTNVFADAVSFAIKSTSPSYVGGDDWGTEEVIGVRPVLKAQGEDESGEDFQEREAVYLQKLTAWESRLEAERQKVDRIAFAGQVPVNVTDSIPGQYIVPVVTANGSITGVAKNEADLTLSEYMRAVGKVIAIEDDGRARIIVKVA